MKITGEGHGGGMSGSSREAQRRKTLGSCAELVITGHECRNECCARPINSLSVRSLSVKTRNTIRSYYALSKRDKGKRGEKDLKRKDEECN